MMCASSELASVILTLVSGVLLMLGVVLGGSIVGLFLSGVKPDPEFLRLPWLARAAMALGIVALLPMALHLLGRLGRHPGGLEKFDESF